MRRSNRRGHTRSAESQLLLTVFAALRVHQRDDAQYDKEAPGVEPPGSVRKHKDHGSERKESARNE